MRGHARGPFATNSNLRVQNVQILLPGHTFQLFVSAKPTAPVLLRICPHVDVATSGGASAFLLGNTSSSNAYYASGDVDPTSVAFGTEKKFMFTADTTIVGSLTAASVAASLALTISAITGADTQTVVIGGQTYTFNTSLTNTANHVLIGADTTAMAANLAAAINAGTGAGTLYGTGTVANTSVSAVAALGVVTVTAKTAGSGGNSIAVSETLTNGAWAGGATTLTGGSNASTAGQMTVFIDA